jgi:hypothetical protein
MDGPRPRKARLMRVSRVITGAVNSDGSILRLLQASLFIIWSIIALSLLVHVPAALMSASAVAQPVLIALLSFGATRAGDVLACICARYNLLSRSRLRQPAGTKSGVRFQVMAGPPRADNYTRGEPLELVFDATITNSAHTTDNVMLPMITEYETDGFDKWLALAAIHEPKLGDLDAAALESGGERRGCGASQRARESHCVERSEAHCGRRRRAGSLGPAARSRCGNGSADVPDHLSRWRELLTLSSATSVEMHTLENAFCRDRGLATSLT